ncbi:MAG TPA: class I SAM-dependent methyltransferase [Candidatus Aquabacterium excrementipullorum]|nr:class I SAM-dependent methyltransferase [Candidatus Aquabacterium excrementipullorum]
MDTLPANARRDFTPAAPFLSIYDVVIAVGTREARWRGALLRQLAAQPGDVIADLGCGTGSFLALLGRQVPGSTLIGVDPDAAILQRAERKLRQAGVPAALQMGYLRDAQALLAAQGVHKIVSSLVFHQVPMAEKRAGLAAILAALPPGGELHVADYGLQRGWLMRWLFKWVQLVDGFADTQPNAEGILPVLMAEVGFRHVQETNVIPTVGGSISIYRAVKPLA